MESRSVTPVPFPLAITSHRSVVEHSGTFCLCFNIADYTGGVSCVKDVFISTCSYRLTHSHSMDVKHKQD